MAMKDPHNVITKCNRMMRANAEAFSRHLGSYKQYENAFYFGEDEDQAIKIGFDSSGKLLSKVFALHASLTVPDVGMERDWQLKARFYGMTSIESLVFKPLQKDDIAIADRLNRNGKLVDQIIRIVSAFDIKDIIITYKKTQQQIQVRIVPYAGTLIWVKIPPLYYDVNLKDFEVEKICELLRIFEAYFKKNRQI